MSDGGHSTALERLVRDPDDIVGLLAYAHYKLNKRDTALEGRLSPEELTRYHLTLTERLIQQYRDNALRRLEAYAEQIVAEATPQIREQTRTESIEAAASRVIAELKSRTLWWHSVVWNVLAWLLTLAITFLVLVSSGKIRFDLGG